MGLILAIVVAVGTVIIAVLIVFANGMSDAPSMEGMSPIPTLVIGFGIAATLAITHFYHFSW